MSINQYYSSNYLIPTSTASYWATRAMFCGQGGATELTFNLNNNEDSSEANERSGCINSELEQEKLFEKPLTPSDVGKLNRLVIPKQQAEKYFPLNGGGGEEKGLLLGFEDEGGKPWRFRYSYWNSSQSYVLTKGWSRFVKEKRLDAGDVVLFARHRRDFGRFFIGWRKRNESGSGQGGGGALYPAYCSQHQGSSSSVVCQMDHASNNTEEVRRGRSGNSKRLRLFGVNLEWPEEEERAVAAAECYTDNHHHHRTWI